MQSVNKSVMPYLSHIRELRELGVPVAEINRILVERGVLSSLANQKTLANAIRLGVQTREHKRLA